MSGVESPSTPPRTGLALQALCLLVVLGALALLAVRGPLPARMESMQVVLAVGSLAWLGSVALAARAVGDLRLVVGGALALRLVAAVGEPSLSDDVYRYLWEGELVAHGVSPYAHAPDDPELASFRERLPEVHGRINHRGIPAAYPPLTQAANALVTAAAHAGWERPGARRGVAAMRLFYGLCDLLVLVPLALLLRRRGLPPGLLVVWAWSPLVALEYAGSAHFDSLGILLLVTGLALATDRDERRSGGPGAREGLGLAALAAGGLVKLLPFAVVPFAVRGPSWRGRALWVALVSVVASLPILSLSGEGGARGLLVGLGEYGTRWEGGSLVFRWVDRALRLRELPYVDPQLVGRAIVAVGWLLGACWAWRRRLAPLAAAGFLVGSFLVWSPTLHPWYVTWMLPFVALRPRFSWLWLAVAAPLLYWPLAGWKARGEWVEPGWVWPILALPFFLASVIEWRARRARAGGVGARPA